MTPSRFGWVLNLDAELELARPGYTPKTSVLRQLATYGAGSRALLGPRDVLIAPRDAARDLDAGVARELSGRAWCPTPSAIATLRAAGVVPEPHPSAEVLRRVNHRRFAFDLGGGLPGQRCVETRSELDPLLARHERPWLLKRPLAFAGRGQLRIYATIDDKQASWIDVSLHRGCLIVEPLVTPTLEVSLHGFVWPDRRHELGRICVQEVTDRGVFRGVRPALPDDLGADEARALLAQGERVAVALGSAGYFGPFGIDAYRYRDRDEERASFCALGEINARYTMGFVTGFPRHPSEITIE